MNRDGANSLINCGCAIFILIFNVVVGAWSVTYLVSNLLHQHIAWGWAALIGLVGGEVSVPFALIVWLLKLAGVL